MPISTADDLTLGLQAATEAVMAGRSDDARRILATLPPTPPAKPRGTPRPTSAPNVEAAPRTRQTVPMPLQLETYSRDDYTCRYCGRLTAFLQVMSCLSALFPKEFPTHPNWKHSACHPAYWTHSTSLEHVVPVARGGDPIAPENLVTACYACQHTKGVRLLDELGWTLLPHASNGWDGLTGIYPALADAAGLVAQRWHRGWIAALQAQRAH